MTPVPGPLACRGKVGAGASGLATSAPWHHRALTPALSQREREREKEKLPRPFGQRAGVRGSA
jgi:hypothetical protein